MAGKNIFRKNSSKDKHSSRESQKQESRKEKPPSEEKRTGIEMHGQAHDLNEGRQKVLKTYKLYIDGKFPRSESDRTYPVVDEEQKILAHAVRGTRKDIRDAAAAARAAHPPWAERTAYNRGQILYRVAEMMEARASSLVEETARSAPKSSSTLENAEREVYTSIDRWVWYAGWADKFSAVLGGANPVAGPYFNFTIPEPMGVIGIVAPNESPLLGLVSRLAPALVSGNSAIVLASERYPLPAISLGEILATSDVPAGVVNIITGHRNELEEHLISHADINAVDISGCESGLSRDVESLAADSVKRLIKTAEPAESEEAQSPYIIADFCEMKTIWHPVGK